jgi:hypothetical protein
MSLPALPAFGTLFVRTHNIDDSYRVKNETPTRGRVLTMEASAHEATKASGGLDTAIEYDEPRREADAERYLAKYVRSASTQRIETPVGLRLNNPTVEALRASADWPKNMAGATFTTTA